MHSPPSETVRGGLFPQFVVSKVFASICSEQAQVDTILEKRYAEKQHVEVRGEHAGSVAKEGVAAPCHN